MKSSEITTGKVYLCKVSNRLVPVRVISGIGGRTPYALRNLQTGRECRGTAAKLRYELQETSEGKWKKVSP